MQIGPSSPATSLLIAGTLPGAGGQSGSGGAFGPSAILSLGNESGADATYALLAANIGATATPQPQQLTESELDALEAAFALLDAGANDEARTALQDLVDRNGRNAAAVHGLGLVELLERDYERAESLFRRAGFLAPGRGYANDADTARILRKDDDAVFEQASRLASSRSSRGRAVRLLQHLTERSPQHAEAQILLAGSLLATNDILAGVDRYLTSLNLADPGQIAQIEVTFEQLVQFAPDQPEYRRVLARAQLKAGRFDEALATLDEAAEQSEAPGSFDTDRALAHVGIGRELLERGEVNRAVAAFEQAEDFEFGHPDVREALAEGYLAQGDNLARLGSLTAAVLSYDEAAQSIGSGGSDTLRLQIGLAAYSAGLRLEQQHVTGGEDLNEEALAFQAAYDLFPDNLAYKRKLAETRNTIGDQYLADGDYAEAAGAYARAHALYKHDTTYKTNLSNAHLLQGDQMLLENNFTAAIEAYRAAYELDIYDENAKSKLAAAYNARGIDNQDKSQPLDAVLDFKEALALYPNNAEYQANYNALIGYDPDAE